MATLFNDASAPPTTSSSPQSPPDNPFANRWSGQHRNFNSMPQGDRWPLLMPPMLRLGPGINSAAPAISNADLSHALAQPSPPPPFHSQGDSPLPTPTIGSTPQAPSIPWWQQPGLPAYQRPALPPPMPPRPTLPSVLQNPSDPGGGGVSFGGGSAVGGTASPGFSGGTTSPGFGGTASPGFGGTSASPGIGGVSFGTPTEAVNVAINGLAGIGFGAAPNYSGFVDNNGPIDVAQNIADAMGMMGFGGMNGIGGWGGTDGFSGFSGESDSGDGDSGW